MIIPQSKLLVNLSQNIEQFLNDVKKLNVDTFDLIKQTTPAKPTIEPINLFRKIAFGSLDLYVLHPTSNSVEDEKILSNIQKVTRNSRIKLIDLLYFLRLDSDS